MCVLPDELLEHPLGVGRVGRLAVDRAVEPDGGVDAEHGPLAGVLLRRRRLPARVLADELDRIGVRGIVLLVVRRDGVERDPELLEDHAALRARRREQDRSGRVRAHRFRAIQISSAGHLPAHSAVTKS